ncbi:MAG TPA: hypothetical protein VFZ53_00565 [Polyangiaceae bacterium]
MFAQMPSCGGASLDGASGGAGGGAGGNGAISHGGTTGGTGEPKPLGGSGGRGGSAARGGTGEQGGSGATGGTDGGFAGDGEQGGSGVTGGSAGAAGTATGGVAGLTPARVCNSPEAWSSNLELCEDGFVHRPQATACALPTRDSEYAMLPANAGREDLELCQDESSHIYCDLGADECTRDDDCGANAFCVRETEEWLSDELRIHHRCVTPCRTDADCTQDELCACDYAIQNATRARVSLGRCMPATCRTDADCVRRNLNGFCIASFQPKFNVHRSWPSDLPTERRFLDSFHCQTPGDQCSRAANCPVFDPTGNDCCPKAVCVYSDTRFVCDAIETCDPC